MKRALFTTALLALLLMCAGVVRGQIEWLPNTPDDAYTCVSHPASGVVYLSGRQGIYKSHDDGDSWETVYTFDSTFSSRFFGMWFLNEQTGFASCARNDKNPSAMSMFYELPPAPLLFKTDDGGVTWQCVDSTHNFFNVQFAGEDTLFALEQTEKALYKSVDGGSTWSCVLNGPNLCDYSVVNSHTVYALQPTRYWGGDDLPTPQVYKTSDGGETWDQIFAPADVNSKDPMKTIDMIYFHKDGKGILAGHQIMITDNDFESYDIVGTGFSSGYHSDDNFQSAFLKSGFCVLTSWDDIDMGGFCKMYISRDFGRHLQGMVPPDNSSYYFTYINDLSGCEADTTFYVATGNDAHLGEFHLNNMYRLRGSNFPPVGIVEHERNTVITVAPNPASSQFKVSSEIPFDRVEVYDSFGRIVHMQTFEHQQETIVYTYQWRNGLYLVKIHTGEGEISNKIIKL